jgi:hypothetical protein
VEDQNVNSLPTITAWKFVTLTTGLEIHKPCPPKIKGLGITQEGAATRWKANGYVDGIGWLEAWGTTLITAMQALQVLAAQRVSQQQEHLETTL